LFNAKIRLTDILQTTSYKLLTAIMLILSCYITQSIRLGT